MEHRSSLAMERTSGITMTRTMDCRTSATTCWTQQIFFFSPPFLSRFVLYVKEKLTDPDSSAKIFMDPNLLSADGTVSMPRYSFSESGEYFLYALSAGGSDWRTLKVKKALGPDQGKDLDDVIEWTKFSSLSWTHDDKGFFYSRYPEPSEHKDDAGKSKENNFNHHICYHRLGTKQSEDIVVYGPIAEHPTWNFAGTVGDDGKWLLVYTYESTDPVSLLHIASLEGFDGGKGKLEFKTINDKFDAEYDYITHSGSVFYFKTNKNAPNYKLVSVDISKSPLEWKDCIVHHDSDVLSSVSCFNTNALMVVYMRDVIDALELWQLPKEGETLCQLVKEFKMVDLGSVSAIRCEKFDPELFFRFSSFLTPGTIFRVDLANPSAEPTVVRETEVHGFKSSDFVSERFFYKSKDGTSIPLFIVRHKSVARTSSNPVFLYGYGGFNISLTPYFSAIRLSWLTNFRGIFALANLRGGGEYGEKWHEAGKLEKKQNVFDDMIAAAEFLVSEKWTVPSKITINGTPLHLFSMDNSHYVFAASGGSNGGLLVCAVVTQRPDLFGAAIADVGVLDMMRFHKFTIGHHWCADFGDPDNAEGDDANYIYAYSPVHNVRPRKDSQYPAVLLRTGDHDDRVSPLHSYKMIAELQYQLGEQPNQTAPLLIRIARNTGHGEGKPTALVLAEHADGYAFIAHHLGLKWVD